MASVEKFPMSAVVNQLRHIERTIVHPSNEDIDPNKRGLNYSLAPDRGVSSYDYFLARKSQLHCHNRADVKPLAGWVVTVPKELPAEQHETFFQSVHNFLCARYGAENCVQSIVHADEAGQPHLHFCFIPVVPDKKHGGEKICANDVLNRRELRNFHPDLQRHLDRAGINAKVHTGITRAQGGNKTVLKLKLGRAQQQEQEREQSIQRGRWG